MEKRLIIAVIVSVVILYMFQAMQPVPDTPPAVDEVATESTVELAEPEPDPDPEEVIEPQEFPAQEETAYIENDNILIEVSSLGSGLRSFKIEDEKEGMVDLILAPSSPLPLSSSLAPETNWALTKTEDGVLAEYSTDRAAYYRKFELDENNILRVSNRIVNLTDRRLNIALNQPWPGGLGTTEDLMEDNPDDNMAFAKIDGSVERDLDTGTHRGKIEWAGISNRYFLAVFLDLQDYFSEVKVETMFLHGEEYPSIEALGRIEVEPGGEAGFSQLVYGGLKEYRTMSALAEDLEGILSFGIFGFLSRLFLNILLVFNSWVGNYGVAIIMLTFLLQFFFIPLTVKSYKSMHAMKELQPEIGKMRKKYKEDPQRMNQEMMALYKRRGVNPLSGCFPLLLQMPVFISLFTMLREVSELRYASFMWIADLSAPDRLFTALPVFREIPFIGQYGPLPFLMGGAMFLQQKVTAGAQGPQKSLTYLMPVIFTFLFMGFPAGLVLYWFTNSVITFIIQFFIGKKKI